MPVPTQLTGTNRLATFASRIASSVSFWFLFNVLAFIAVLIVNFGFSPATKWWSDFFSVATNLLTGGIASFLFYFLVVFLPEKRKKSIISTNLRSMYRTIKKDILWEVIFASQKGGRRDLQADLDTIDALMTVEGFRVAFEEGREADEGFYAFQNQMSDDTTEFRAIKLNLEIMAKQIDYVLHNYTIEDQKVFDFFKRLEVFLIKTKQSDAGYDESKALCGFVYEIFAGWSVIEGYRGYDIIEKMIKEI